MIESPSLPPRAELQSEPLPMPDRPFGRVARSVIGYGLLIALMFATPMFVFVPAALMHSAARNGRNATWAAVVVAVAIGALYAAGSPAATEELAMLRWVNLAGAVFAIVLPTMAALPLVERRASFGHVLLFLLTGAAVGLAAVEIGMVSIASFSPYAAVVAQGKKVAADSLAFYRSQGIPSDMLRMMERVSDHVIFVAPALMLIQAAFVFVLSLLMTARLRTWRDHVERREESDPAGTYLFRNLVLPDWLLFGFVLGGLTPLATGMLQKVAANVLLVVVFLYVLQGLAIFRFMLVAVGAGLIGTLFGWTLLIVLVFTGLIGLLLLGLAGLFDPFFDFRHFKKRKDDSHESHSD